MDLGRRRTRSSTVVASGSVMKLDEVVKVVNGGNEEMGSSPGGSSARKSPIGVVGKRRTWKSEVGSVQISKVRSGSVSDAEKSPIQGRRKLRSERSLSLSGSVDGGIGSPVRVTRKLRSDSVSLRPSGESRRESLVSDGTENESSIQLKQPEPEPEEERIEVVDEEEKSEVGNGGSGIDERDPVVVEVEEEEEEDMEFGLCQEKSISSLSNNASAQEKCGGDESDDVEEKDVEDEGDEIEATKVEVDDVEEEDVEDEGDEIEATKVEVDDEKKSIDHIKEMNVEEPEQKPNKKVVILEEEEPTKVVVEEIKKIQQLNTKPAVTMASTVKRRAPPPPSPVIRRSTIYQNHPPTKPRVSDQSKKFPHTQSKLQSLADLVMWRDVSRSAFIFGIGTFVIVSSSYTQDLNISFISVISYLGLVYLATVFLYKSIICRGAIDHTDDSSYVVGEGEAIWLLKLILPYLNEFLLKLRALFSGDPSTTMKLAVLLFVLARCGSSITIWKMAKFGFFGVFTVPKVCSSYSTQITAYGKFWIRRFGDAWESCSHKKAVAFAIFTLVWNLSSIVARIWAVFMVFVGMRYYQQSMMVRSDDWVEVEDDDDNEEEEETWQQGHENGPETTSVELNKIKKRS